MTYLGDMSLVGTRPPTVDEWDKYELHHRARLATKPGLTGMWQVSGRSNITDLEHELLWYKDKTLPRYTSTVTLVLYNKDFFQENMFRALEDSIKKNIG